MPQKKKKTVTDKATEPSANNRSLSVPEPTEKELILKAELDAVTAEVDNVKQRVKTLQQDNEWLQKEAQQIRVETHEYMSYIEKKVSKRQTTIVTLSDHNKQEIENIENQKKMLTEEFEEKKQKLKSIMLEKQHMLAKTKKELDSMDELKSLQQNQAARIKELEAQITEKRAMYSQKVQDLKSAFLREKKQSQEESDEKIEALKNEANKEAVKCLTEHTNNIKKENRELREKLMGLIKKTRELQVHRDHLEEQKRQLLRDQQYTEDMRALRNLQK